MTIHRPPHDPHRVDAVLACALCTIHEASSDPDVRPSFADAHDGLRLAIDARALLALRPLTGEDADYGRFIADHVTGRAAIPAADAVASDRAVAHACAARLAVTAIACSDDPNVMRSTAQWLWRASEALSGVGLPPLDVVDPPRAERLASTSAADAWADIRAYLAEYGILADRVVSEAAIRMDAAIGMLHERGIIAKSRNERRGVVADLMEAHREQPGARERIWARIEAELERGAPNTQQDAEGLNIEETAHARLFGGGDG